jgi:hypothetical protein
MEEQTGASVDIKSQDTEVDVDNNATDVEDVPVKSEAVVELLMKTRNSKAGRKRDRLLQPPTVKMRGKRGSCRRNPNNSRIVVPCMLMQICQRRLEKVRQLLIVLRLNQTKALYHNQLE